MGLLFLLELGDCSPELRALEEDLRRNAANPPVAHPLKGARLARNPKDFGNFLGAAEQFDDVGVWSHDHIKHHVYTQVNTAFNP